MSQIPPSHTPSRIQRLFRRLLPRPRFEAMAADSHRWKVRCLTCGHERSIWELGGIRWGASSSGKRVLVRCPRCGRLRCASVTKSDR